eukprot:snap_masked-scaffold_7-processed-gene-8.38-mRNA-1 protein AED:1.00 eAED:1.00 QI:0/0/0/0/1/1/3/0/79
MFPSDVFFILDVQLRLNRLLDKIIPVLHYKKLSTSNPLGEVFTFSTEVDVKLGFMVNNKQALLLAIATLTDLTGHRCFY